MPKGIKICKNNQIHLGKLSKLSASKLENKTYGRIQMKDVSIQQLQLSQPLLKNTRSGMHIIDMEQTNHKDVSSQHVIRKAALNP